MTNILDDLDKYTGSKKVAVQIDNNVCVGIITALMNDYGATLADNPDGPILILSVSYRQLCAIRDDYGPYIVYFEELDN